MQWNAQSHELVNRSVAPAPASGGKSGSAAASAPVQVRVASNVQAAKLIRRVEPDYPPLAKAHRIFGVVRFRVVIAKDGTVRDLTVVSGPPLLCPAAEEAVRQWLYKPTLIGSHAVEVLTIVDVAFLPSQDQ